jgi:hypothetical protein
MIWCRPPFRDILPPPKPSRWLTVASTTLLLPAPSVNAGVPAVSVSGAEPITTVKVSVTGLGLSATTTLPLYVPTAL